MKVGDYVTRKKYNHDIIFRIIKIENDKVFLHGEMFRLIADTTLEDLELYSSSLDEKELDVLIDQDNSMIKGKILHVDGDKTYLEKCMNFYKEYTTPVVGCYLQEDKMKENVLSIGKGRSKRRYEKRKIVFMRRPHAPSSSARGWRAAVWR